MLYKAIRTENLTKHYGQNVYGVRDLDLEVESGEVFGLLGLKGGGKTTLVRALTGFGLAAATGTQKTYGRAIVDAGADLVLGHHPHVVGGIEMMARGEVRFNRISGATSFGLETTLARARVHDNDVRGNEGTDCVDGTVARRTGWPENFGTANRWTNNRGDDATPAGICTPAAS